MPVSIDARACSVSARSSQRHCVSPISINGWPIATISAGADRPDRRRLFSVRERFGQTERGPTWFQLRLPGHRPGRDSTHGHSLAALRARRDLPRCKRPVSQVTSPGAFRTCASERRWSISKSRSWRKIKNVCHSRLCAHHRSAFLCHTKRVWDTLSNTPTSTSDDAHSVERTDPLPCCRSALRVACGAEWARLLLHPFPFVPDLSSTSGSTGVGSARLFARACCGVGAWNSPIQADTLTKALARPPTTCTGASDRDRVSSAEL